MVNIEEIVIEGFIKVNENLQSLLELKIEISEQLPKDEKERGELEELLSKNPKVTELMDKYKELIFKLNL